MIIIKECISISVFTIFALAPIIFCSGKLTSELNGAEDHFENFISRKVRNITQHESPTSWPGRWFPDSPSSLPLSRHRPSLDSNPQRLDSGKPYTKEENHIRYIYSLLTPNCDDGKTNLTMDWDYSIVDYLCLLPPSVRFQPDAYQPAKLTHHFVPKKFVAGHYCMSDKIDYPPGIVTFGSHRPAWPKYGEYVYLPPQRYLHNAEHGAVIMLYHPCAHPMLVNRLKSLVKSCISRHIITPSRRLDEKYPLALVTWGWSLRMSTVDPYLVREFIRERALKGTEQIFRNGIYSLGLIHPAELVSDEEDSRLCPNQSNSIFRK